MKRFAPLLSLFPLMETRYWPRLLFYFFGTFLKNFFGLSLFKTILLPFKRIKIHGDIEGITAMGLVFLPEVLEEDCYSDLKTDTSSGTALLFDVGANCGFFAILRCLQNPNLRALCFEPHPLTFRILEENIRLNGLEKRVHCLNKALGREEREHLLEVSPYSSMAKILDDHSIPHEKTGIKILTTSLDGFLHSKGYLGQALKIDVEGFEEEVLRGAQSTLLSLQQVILEYHSEELKARSHDLLKEAGFQIRERGDNILYGHKGTFEGLTKHTKI